MKRVLRYFMFCLLVLQLGSIYAQKGFLLTDNTSKKINFELIGNLIIIPVEINGIRLSFVLDSGVSKPILFNLSNRDSLQLKDTETFYLHGLGANGKIEALKSKHNTFKIGNAINTNQDVFVVYEASIDFTPRLGVLVHGIIGYDIFRNFVVELNYSSKYMRLHKPNTFELKGAKKWKTIPIEIHKRKAYIDASVTVNKTIKPVKLLIDTGSSDALWLFENHENKINPNKNLVFRDFLGKGLSGSVYGNRSKVESLQLSDYIIKNSNVAYPDSLSIDFTKLYKERNGSIGGEILKRFNMFIDYSHNRLYLKKNSAFKNRFTYNNSGIVVEYNGNMFVKEQIKVAAIGDYNRQSETSNRIQINLALDYRLALKPAYSIVEVRTTSNAYLSGLRKGDILISINNQLAYNYKLSRIIEILHGEPGKTIRVKIERKGVSMDFKFKLDDIFKKNEPPN